MHSKHRKKAPKLCKTMPKCGVLPRTAVSSLPQGPKGEDRRALREHTLAQCPRRAGPIFLLLLLCDWAGWNGREACSRETTTSFTMQRI